MANDSFVVVAFPVLEFPELKRYITPTITTEYATIEEAKASAIEFNLIAGGMDWTYDAMTRAEFNKLES